MKKPSIAAYIDIITIILFVICILLPVLFSNCKPEQVSEIDNTKLMDIEDINAESFTTDFEKYATERIGFRTQFIDSYITLNDRLFNILEHPIYEYGKDGYVFFHMPSEKYDKSYIKLFAKFIQRMENYLNNRDIDFLYCINPNKTAVYKDY
ncbi:MAG: hypothetical protein ACI4UK_00570, partial [Floccifex sp.]